MTVAVAGAGLARSVRRRLRIHREVDPIAAQDRSYELDTAGTGHSRRYTLRQGRRVIVESPSKAAALDALERDVDHFVARHARDRLFIHAGVAVWRGRAVIVPGRSRTGKSSLVVALVRAGARYYSDEYAVLDARGRVHAYPRDISVRGRTRTNRVTAERLGGRRGARPAVVSLIVVSRFRAGARWSCVRISPAQAQMALLANTVAVRKEPANAMKVLADIATRATAIRAGRGEAAEAAQAILQLLASDPAGIT